MFSCTLREAVPLTGLDIEVVENVAAKSTSFFSVSRSSSGFFVRGGDGITHQPPLFTSLQEVLITRDVSGKISTQCTLVLWSF